MRAACPCRFSGRPRGGPAFRKAPRLFRPTPAAHRQKRGRPLIHAAHGVDVGVLKTRLDGMQFNTFTGKRAVVRIAEHHADTVALNERIADIRLLLPAGQHRPRFAGRRHEGKDALRHGP